MMQDAIDGTKLRSKHSLSFIPDQYGPGLFALFASCENFFKKKPGLDGAGKFFVALQPFIFHVFVYLSEVLER